MRATHVTGWKNIKVEKWNNGKMEGNQYKPKNICNVVAYMQALGKLGQCAWTGQAKIHAKAEKQLKNGKKFTSRTSRLEKWKNAH